MSAVPLRVLQLWLNEYPLKFLLFIFILKV